MWPIGVAGAVEREDVLPAVLLPHGPPNLDLAEELLLEIRQNASRTSRKRLMVESMNIPLAYEA